MTLIDLSHPVEHGVPTYPGLPAPSVRHHLSYQDSAGQIIAGREFAIDLITLIGGSSTYMDAPRHYDRRGADIAALPLERLFDVPAIVVPAPADGRREYRPEDFADVDLQHRAVLLATGWDSRWGTADYLVGSPFLGPAATRHLVEAEVAFVGIDAILIDDIHDAPVPQRDAHALLLAAQIPIIENMTRLTALPPVVTRVTAVPPPVRGVGSFPVRVFARVE